MRVRRRCTLTNPAGYSLHVIQVGSPQIFTPFRLECQLPARRIHAP